MEEEEQEEDEEGFLSRCRGFMEVTYSTWRDGAHVC